jgi:hypothetical protein
MTIKKGIVLCAVIISIVLIAACGGSSTENVYQHRLNIQTIGWGNVSASPDAESYTEDTEIILTATPDVGWEMAGWEGDASGSSNPLTITMGTSDMQVIARFDLVDYNVDVTIEPSGAGTVIFDPQQSIFHLNDVIELTPSAANGYFFDRWSGDTATTSEILNLTVSDDISLTANFIGSGADSVTLEGTVTWPGHTLSYPILVLFDQDFNIQAAWFLDGGSSSADIMVKFSINDVPSSYIHAVDNLDNDNTIFETGEPWNCYDGNGDYYCDFIYYTSGEIIENIDIELYSGAQADNIHGRPVGPITIKR